MGPVLGKIERREATVRRKPSSGFIWEGLTEGSDLYRKDYVQTGPDSQALIRLNDDVTLELEENSLVIIEDVGDLALNFLKGGGVLRSKTGESQIEAGLNGAQAKITQSRYQTTEPKPLSEIITTSSAVDVSFAWAKQDTEKSSGLVLEVSRSEGFDPGATQRVSVGAAANTKLKLEKGRYFWRMVENGKPVSSASVFQISVVPTLHAHAPMGAVVRPEGRSHLSFQWSGLPAAETGVGRLEIAADAAFAKVLFAQTVALESGRANIADLGALNLDKPRYFWRIIGEFKGAVVATKVLQFSWSDAMPAEDDAAAPPAQLEQSQIGQPKDDVKIMLTKNEQLFSWMTLKKATHYEVEFARDTQFKEIIKREKVPHNYVLIRLRFVGTSYWRVRGVMNETPGEWSGARKFTVVAE